MPNIKKKVKRPWITQRAAQEGRTHDNQSFYNGTTWRKYSTLYRRESPLCEVSNDAGHTIRCDVVDHIIPINQGGSRLDPHNHMSMCHAKHNKKSGMEKHTDILIPWKLNQDKGKIPINRNDIIKLLNQ